MNADNPGTRPEENISPMHLHGGFLSATATTATDPRGRVRLLCVGRDLHGGGAQRVHLCLLNHIDRSRFDIRLFYLKDEGALRDFVPQHLELTYGASRNQNHNIRIPWVLARLFRRAQHSDLIFAMQDGRPIHFAGLVGWLTGRPVVGWIHNCWSQVSQDLSAWHTWAARLVYPHITHLIGVSEGVVKELLKVHPHFFGKVSAVPNPLPIQQIQTQAQAPIPRWAKHIFAKRTVVAAGWLIPLKGFDILLRAFARLIQTGLDLNLIILGEGNERAGLERLAGGLGLRERVFMPGFQINPYPFFARADVFALSSRFEALPTVVLEALCLGLPVVATDCPYGPREILGDARYGVLVPPESPAALARGIDALLSSPDMSARFRASGFERAKFYDASRVARLFESIFLQCVGHSQAPLNPRRKT